MTGVRYISADELVRIHVKVAENASVRDQGLLGSAAGRPRASFDGVDVHADLYEKAAALMLGVLMNHPFTDGNKRTAWLSSMVFLTLNGHLFPRVQNQIAIDTILSAIENKEDVPTVAARLRDISENS